MSVPRICEAIIRDEKSILPVSTIQHGMYGIEGLSLSMPAVVGEHGVETQVPIPLNEEEQAALRASAEALKNVIAELDLG
jgi:L-lactate dehydrogenase